MRLSQIPMQTLREDPSDAEIPSHKLLVRAGYIQKLASGIYIYSPLMWRVLRKVSNIVREEMDREGGNEMMMPILQPREIWEESHRWTRYIADGILFHLQDSKDADLCLGPTHEEVITTYVKRICNSYKQLPFNLYQIQDKFRDEIRPRFGLMRGREFIMKDAYSFDADTAGLDKSYDAMNRAYHKVFERCGLEFAAVEADAGAIGGSGSQEFMVIANNGEDAILFCERSDYAANVEKADSRVPASPDGGAAAPLRKLPTPNVRTVEELSALTDPSGKLPDGASYSADDVAVLHSYKRDPARMAKTVLYEATYKDEVKVVAVMMRGDLEINEVKLGNALDALAVKLAEEATVKRVTNADVGFAGPIGLAPDVRILADNSLKGMTNLLTGCCETDFHCFNVNPGRDFPQPEFRDLRKARAGEGCPRCDGALVGKRGIEVGHIFKLGTKYSEAMDATFLDQDGKRRHFVMGCYGIGISRTAQSAVEQNFDENGIIWPRPIAPFEVVVAILDPKKTEQVELAERLYGELKQAGIDACLDDRPLSPGVKFKDLDLLGFPVRVVVGRRATEGIVEFSERKTPAAKQEIPAAEALAIAIKR